MQIKTGRLTCCKEDGKSHTAIVTLGKDDILIERLMKKQTPQQETSDRGTPKVDNEIILDEKLRTVTIHRQLGSGLGISVKGGAEHGIPVLISKVFSGKPADRTGKLFPGDAILTVGGLSTTDMKHDDVVELLKSCDGDVTLTVRAFDCANRVLRSAQGATNDAKRVNGTFATSKAQLPQVSISLQFARIKKKYIREAGGENNLSFQVIGGDGLDSGFLRSDTIAETKAWLTDISTAVHAKNSEYVSHYNSTVKDDHTIHTVGWLDDCTSEIDPRACFVVLHRDCIYLFDDCTFLSKKSKEWNPSFQNLAYECLFRFMTGENDTTNCILMQVNPDPPSCYAVETQDELHRWSLAIREFVDGIVYDLKRKSYSCLWDGKDCHLTLDFNDGFLLQDKRDQSEYWSYKYSQLKGSSDDGGKCVTFSFMDKRENRLEERIISCDRAYSLLFCVHSFLAAKLAIVDPQYFKGEIVVKTTERDKAQNLPCNNHVQQQQS